MHSIPLPTLASQECQPLFDAVQAFTVAHPVWLKYLQFHFITQYGSEPMCALNDVLVHGKSAAEDLEDQLSASALLPEDDLQPVSKPDGVKQQLGAAQQSAASAETALAVQQEAGNNSVTNVLDDVVTKERPGTGDANAALHAVALDPVQSGKHKLHVYASQVTQVRHKCMKSVLTKF